VSGSIFIQKKENIQEEDKEQNNKDLLYRKWPLSTSQQREALVQ